MSNGVDNPGFQKEGDGRVSATTKEKNINAAYDASHDDVHVVVKEPGDKGKTKESEGGDDHRFGWGPFKPSCLQWMNRMWLFVVWAFILCLIEGFAVNGIANAALPSIEKQFQLSSTKSALIPSSQDIGALCVVLFVSFLGARYHKPRWVAAGSITMGIGSFLFIVPHLAEKYIFPDSSPALTATGVCNGTSGAGSPPSETCESEGEKYLPVFVLAQMVHGFGFTPMFTLGTVYIDENEDHSLAAVYIGLTYAAAAVGVAAGFFAGGQIIQNVFVDFDRVSVEFTAQDSRWIGAWWFGFIFTAIGFALVAIPIFAYPKSMRDNEDVENKSKDGKKDQGLCSLIIDVVKQFIKAFFKLVTNPIYMSLNLAGCAQTLIISGVGAFSFKFLSEQYNLSFDVAGNLIGGLILVGSFGMFFGGLLVRIFHLEVIGMTRLNAFCTLLSALLGISFLAGCPEVPLAGLEVPYTNSSSIIGYYDSCHASCNCGSQPFSVVCGSDNKVYYSPCHAGCSSSEGFGPMATYGNCSCIVKNVGEPDTGNKASAVAGRCADDCSNLKILAPCLFIALVCVLTAATPTSMATLRCVDEELRPFALGIQWMFFRLLGTIPGPVLVGWVIDQACLLWQGTTCGSQGACLLYSHDKLSIGVLIWWVLVSLVASLFFFIASLLSLRYKKGITLSHE